MEEFPPKLLFNNKILIHCKMFVIKISILLLVKISFFNFNYICRFLSFGSYYFQIFYRKICYIKYTKIPGYVNQNRMTNNLSVCIKYFIIWSCMNFLDSIYLCLPVVEVGGGGLSWLPKYYLQYHFVQRRYVGELIFLKLEFEGYEKN